MDRHRDSSAERCSERWEGNRQTAGARGRCSPGKGPGIRSFRAWMQEEREAGEQGHRQAVVWGGAGPSSSPSPHPVSASGRQAEQSIHGRHTGPWGVGSAHHGALAMTQATHMGRRRAGRHGPGQVQRRQLGRGRHGTKTEGPWSGETPGWPPIHVGVRTHGSTWTRVHTETHVLVYAHRHVGTNVHVCKCAHARTLRRCHAARGVVAEGIPRIREGAAPHFQAGKRSPGSTNSSPEAPSSSTGDGKFCPRPPLGCAARWVGSRGW